MLQVVLVELAVQVKLEQLAELVVLVELVLVEQVV